MVTHPLKAFVRDSVSDFAERAGVSRTSLSRVLSGKRNRLNADACIKLSDATDGKVAVRTLLDWEWPGLAKVKKPARQPTKRTAAAGGSGR